MVVCHDTSRDFLVVFKHSVVFLLMIFEVLVMP